jgi:hypothetical protein
MRRLSLLALFTLILVPGAGQAQIGGRLRGAVTGAVTGQQKPAAAVQIVVVPITAQTVANYEKALAARSQEIQRLARENTPIGQYYAAQLRHDAAERRREEYRAGRGPDKERANQLMARLQNGDTTAVAALTALEQSVNNVPEAPSQNDWQAQQAANAHMDSIMVQAAGYSRGEWAYVVDKVPPVASYVAQVGVKEDSLVSRIAQQFQLTAAEVRAIGARRIELAQAAGWRYQTDEQIAAANNPAPAQQQPVDESPTGKYNACLATELKPLMDEAERRSEEFKNATNSGDMSKVLEYSNRLTTAQQAATQKCAPLLNP